MFRNFQAFLMFIPNETKQFMQKCFELSIGICMVSGDTCIVTSQAKIQYTISGKRLYEISQITLVLYG